MEKRSNLSETYANPHHNNRCARSTRFSFWLSCRLLRYNLWFVFFLSSLSLLVTAMREIPAEAPRRASHAITAVWSHPPGSVKKHKAHGYREEGENWIICCCHNERPVSRGHIPEIESQTMKFHPFKHPQWRCNSFGWIIMGSDFCATWYYSVCQLVEQKGHSASGKKPLCILNTFTLLNT